MLRNKKSDTDHCSRCKKFWTSAWNMWTIYMYNIYIKYDDTCSYEQLDYMIVDVLPVCTPQIFVWNSVTSRSCTRQLKLDIPFLEQDVMWVRCSVLFFFVVFFFMGGFHIWGRTSLGYNAHWGWFSVSSDFWLKFAEKNIFKKYRITCHISWMFSPGKYPLWDLLVWLWLTCCARIPLLSFVANTF